jgi:uncharacterized glyoxalase superfamily protein PhnB
VHTTLRAQLDRGRARRELIFPVALAPHAAFEIEAPHSAILYNSQRSSSARSPARCGEGRCTYVLDHHRAPERRQIIAQLEKAGRYAFEVVQRTAYGDVRGSLALHVH